jgi:hypothetical protein
LVIDSQTALVGGCLCHQGSGGIADHGSQIADSFTAGTTTGQARRSAGLQFSVLTYHRVSEVRRMICAAQIKIADYLEGNQSGEICRFALAEENSRIAAGRKGLREISRELQVSASRVSRALQPAATSKFLRELVHRVEVVEQELTCCRECMAIVSRLSTQWGRLYKDEILEVPMRWPDNRSTESYFAGKL